MGAKSTAAVLQRHRHIVQIPAQSRDWHVSVTAPAVLAESLRDNHELALLFRDLATLRTDVPVFESVEEPALAGADASVSRNRHTPGRCRDREEC